MTSFLPYAMNQAADALSIGFQAHYKRKYGMLRTEWRVLFHLGQFGNLTATQICDRARLHKTKVSRAVRALEEKRFLTRQAVSGDRRHSLLCLTKHGKAAFEDLLQDARDFDRRIRATLSEEEAVVLHRCLNRIIQLAPEPPSGL